MLWTCRTHTLPVRDWKWGGSRSWAGQGRSGAERPIFPSDRPAECCCLSSCSLQLPFYFLSWGCLLPPMLLGGWEGGVPVEQ